MFAFFAMCSTKSWAQFAQRPVLTDEEVVSEMVTKEIDAEFKSESFLKRKNKKFGCTA